MQRILLCSILCAIPSITLADDWPRFRGPNGSGVAQAEIPTTWTEADYNWRIKLPGKGHSSPVVWKRAVFVTAGNEADGTRHVLRIDGETGRTVWTRSFSGNKGRKHQLNSFATSTPAVDGEFLYIAWGSAEEFIVLALDHNGQEQWRVDLGPYKAGHGEGVSPIVFEDLVVVGNDQQGDSSIVALDRRNGKIRWRVPRATKVAYCSPCVYQPAGRPAELIFTTWELGVTAVDPATGRTNWQIQVFDQSHIETSIGSPIVAGNLVFGTCGWLGHAMHTVAVRPKSDQPGEAEEVFRVDRGAPLTTTPLVVDGLLFLWADNGIVTCVDAATGKRHWQQRVGGTYYSSPVAANKAIYGISAAGEAVVLAASSQFQELARNQLQEGSHSTPAIAGGRMYLRTFGHLMSLGGGE